MRVHIQLLGMSQLTAVCVAVLLHASSARALLERSEQLVEDWGVEELAKATHLRKACKGHQVCVEEFTRSRPRDHWNANTVKKYAGVRHGSKKEALNSPLFSAMATSNFCAASGRCARCSACRMDSMSFDGRCPKHCFSASQQNATVRKCRYPKSELVVGICHEEGNPVEVKQFDDAEINDSDLEQAVYTQSAYGEFLRFVAESLPINVKIHRVVNCASALQSAAGRQKYDILMMAGAYYPAIRRKTH
jgi:hypothetical protein